MRTALLFVTVLAMIVTSCAYTPPVNENTANFAYARESGNFSDSGAIALHEGGYRFTIILVRDLEWAWNP